MACRVTHLQLHDVDGVGHQDDHIHTSTCHLHLRAHIDIEHREDEIKRVFIEAFFRSCFGQFLFEAFDIGNSGEIRLHVTHGKVDIALLECSPEFQGKAYLHVTAV